MSRASWKYHHYASQDIESYINYLTEYNNPEIIFPQPTITIHKLNYFKPIYLYTGKWGIEFKFTRYHKSFKYGQFRKTRKPFYFRSKKKKKC